MFSKFSKSLMVIRDLRCMVHLGCTEEEREVLQEISVSIHIKFSQPILGEQTDKLEDTICYADIIRLTQSLFLKDKYSLIEKMCRDLYNVLTEVNISNEYLVVINKLNPPVPGIRGGVSYSCGDFVE